MVEEINENNFRNLHKTQSVAELMAGRETSKQLPENFYEKVLELEIQLKKRFNMEVLQKLVEYYSKAIEYYESLGDPKFKHFQSNLNILLTQPEVLYKMNRHVNSQAANKYKKDQVKRQIKYKISEHKGKQLDVKEIIKNADRPHSEEKEIIRNIVNKELEDQQNNFKRRLEEKKKKNLLSTSDITDIENVKTLMSCTNKSNFDLINNVDEIEENVLDDYPNDSNNNILLEIDNEDFKDVSEEISFTPGELSKGKIRTSKQKQIFNDLQDITEGFLSEFNFYFYEEIFQSVVNEIEKRLKVKQQKSLEISKNYNSQIKEMEFLLSSDTEATYQEQIKAIIDQLKAEEGMEFEKLEDDSAQAIKEIKKKFRTEGLKANSGIQLIEEKFRLDMYNSIMNIINPKGK